MKEAATSATEGPRRTTGGRRKAKLRDLDLDSLTLTGLTLHVGAGENLPKGADRFLGSPPDLLLRESSKGSSRGNQIAHLFTE
jgi:hypothetical protein